VFLFSDDSQRISMHLRIIASLAVLLAFGSAASAEDYTKGGLKVGNPYARATVPKQPAGAAYLTLENSGRQPDRLLGASSPLAQSVEIHSMTMAGNVMKMRAVDAIALPPAAKVVMAPGDGYHFMLLGLKQPLTNGERFPLRLKFEKAGQLDVMVRVEPAGAASASPGSSAATHHH
jgi:periplasmic copper chaperone A